MWLWCAVVSSLVAVGVSSRGMSFQQQDQDDDIFYYDNDDSMDNSMTGYGAMMPMKKQQQTGYGMMMKKQQQTGYGTMMKKQQKIIKCYQCAFSPGKTSFKEVHVPRTIKEKVRRRIKVKMGYGFVYKNIFQFRTKQVYEIKKVPEKKKGGWDKCEGEFMHEEAEHYGIDVWKCHDNCYTRYDKNGNIFRGCYKGEYNVDPTMMGCNEQEKATWCFCEGDKCNNMDERMMNNNAMMMNKQGYMKMMMMNADK